MSEDYLLGFMYIYYHFIFSDPVFDIMEFLGEIKVCISRNAEVGIVIILNQCLMNADSAPAWRVVGQAADAGLLQDWQDARSEFHASDGEGRGIYIHVTQCRGHSRLGRNVSWGPQDEIKIRDCAAGLPSTDRDSRRLVRGWIVGFCFMHTSMSFPFPFLTCFVYLLAFPSLASCRAWGNPLRPSSLYFPTFYSIF